jgi:hypothetical protein
LRFQDVSDCRRTRTRSRPEAAPVIIIALGVATPRQIVTHRVVQHLPEVEEMMLARGVSGHLRNHPSVVPQVRADFRERAASPAGPADPQDSPAHPAAST